MIRPGFEADRAALADAEFFDPHAVACLVAEAADGRPIGYAVVSSAMYGQPCQSGRYFLHVAVAPPHWDGGIEVKLYEEALQKARAAGATSVICRVDLADETAYGLAVRRGFTTAFEMVHSELDLPTFDDTRLQGALRQATDHCVRFSTLADYLDKDTVIEQLYRLDEELSRDVPEWSGVMPPLDEYRKTILESDPAGVLLAWQYGELVGMALNGPGDDGAGYTNFMGVKSTHRGLGIALALKALTIDWARERGFVRLETDNNAESLPILSLNRRLGYKVTGRAAHMVKELNQHPFA